MKHFAFDYAMYKKKQRMMMMMMMLMTERYWRGKREKDYFTNDRHIHVIYNTALYILRQEK